MSRKITPGATDQSTVIRILDSTDGTPEQAVEHDTAGIALWYRREDGLKVAISPVALLALDTAHADGGIEHIDDGYYRLDLPDAAVAAGVTGVAVGGAVTGMVIVGAYHEIEAPQTGDSFVRIGATGSGLTSLASAANASTAATKATLAADILEGDEDVDDTTDSTIFNQTIKIKGTATELVRKKLRKRGSTAGSRASVTAVTDIVISRKES